VWCEEANRVVGGSGGGKMDWVQIDWVVVGPKF
jgi:hypothetical protein